MLKSCLPMQGADKKEKYDEAEEVFENKNFLELNTSLADYFGSGSCENRINLVKLRMLDLIKTGICLINTWMHSEQFFSR